MAVRIRLKKMGRTNRPHYRLVAMEAQSKRDGAEIEILGHYDPMAKDNDKRLAIKRERIQHWLKVGAQPSDTVVSLLRKVGLTRKGESKTVEAKA